MTEIRIEYDDTQVQAALNRLLHAGRDMSPAMRVIAGHLKAGAQKAFLTETAPDGTKWPGLSDTTKKRRQKSGHTPIKILQQSGDLAGSITADSDATSAVAGTNLVYATTHQFGALKGAFGTNRRGAPIPWGDIPARPFLGVSDETSAQIIDAISDFISEQWR